MEYENKKLGAVANCLGVLGACKESYHSDIIYTSIGSRLPSRYPKLLKKLRESYATLVDIVSDGPEGTGVILKSLPAALQPSHIFDIECILLTIFQNEVEEVRNKAAEATEKLHRHLETKLGAMQESFLTPEEIEAKYIEVNEE